MKKLLLNRRKNELPNVMFCIFLVLFIVFLIFFNKGIVKTKLLPDDGSSFEKARVVEIIQDNIQDNGERSGMQIVKVQILSGEHKNTVCEAQNMDSYLYGATCEVGTKVIVQMSEYNGKISSSIYNYDRGNILYILIGLFFAVICLIGGRKGISSGFALIFTVVCIIFLYVPMMYVGFSPFFSAVVIVILTTIVTMYLIGGYSLKTLCAILGTIAGVVVAGIIAYIFGKLAHISGFNVSDIESLIYVGQNSKLQIGGVLFSGILIASLGAVMDVSISVASTISEIHKHRPNCTVKELFNSGISVGRDMMGTMSNTLILAFTGGSINILIMVYAYNMPYLQIINMYSIGIEILQGFSGTLGVILTVPFVSVISSVLMVKKNVKLSQEKNIYKDEMI